MVVLEKNDLLVGQKFLKFGQLKKKHFQWKLVFGCKKKCIFIKVLSFHLRDQAGLYKGILQEVSPKSDSRGWAGHTSCTVQVSEVFLPNSWVWRRGSTIVCLSGYWEDFLQCHLVSKNETIINLGEHDFWTRKFKNTSLTCIVQEVWPAQPLEWDWGLTSGSVPLYSPAWSLGTTQLSFYHYTKNGGVHYKFTYFLVFFHACFMAWQSGLIKKEAQCLYLPRILNFSKIGP